MIDLRERFPDVCDASYETLVASMGLAILVQEDRGSYQGDSLMLVRDEAQPDRFGVLSFGWGSCSGCDCLQACMTHEDLAELRDDLARGVVWGTTAETLAYVRTHDWQGDFWGEDAAPFVARATGYLEVLAG